ncbi:MAG: DUF1156 domain-containing protein, partial [Chloroflexi bacterium]|nr:DUF1156 domain-containing protein [Chloroflexota bacterium]
MVSKHNSSTTDRRLIEDYLPIEAISAEARREKSVRQGHISTLHLWWARRPLVACRAAVFGALVPAGAASPDFVADLCTYPGPRDKVQEAQRLILETHAARLTAERGELVTVEDIEAGRAPRPRVLDMFAGGGSIPLEALRLGCEAYALELNPVAHLIELCTLVYPQKYGQPDPAAKGCAKDGTWAGLAAEVEYWGKWVLERVKAEIGDLYPPIYVPREGVNREAQLGIPALDAYRSPSDASRLTPVAYLWTRTVRCKNPACGGTVPLVRQTWLCKKPGRYVALKIDAEANRDKTPFEKKVRFRVVETTTERDLGFDPEAGSKAGNVACPFCGTVADSSYVKTQGQAGFLGFQAMAIACTANGEQGKRYFSADDLPPQHWSPDSLSHKHNNFEKPMGVQLLDEPLVGKAVDQLPSYGMGKYGDLYTSRQRYALFSFVKGVHEAEDAIRAKNYGPEQALAILSFLGLMVDRLSDFCSTLCLWNYTGGRGTKNTFARQALPMTWDFAETNPFNSVGANWQACIEAAVTTIRALPAGKPCEVSRGTAVRLPYPSTWYDAVVTDPPYYDNIVYADLSDYFYVWLKRTVGHLYPEHLSANLSPKKGEAVAHPSRFAGNARDARTGYERMMAEAFAEARRVLKPYAPLVVVYAHKTTLGWATLVDALKTAGFVVSEAWPLDTERPSRTVAMGTAALASSIFLVAR